MAKEFFRFLRGELNGFYLTSIYNTCNKYASDMKDFLSNFSRMTFKTLNEITGNETSIGEEYLTGLEQFTGVFPPRVTQDSIVGSLRFTSSYTVEGVERSERGLYNLSGEVFRFVHTENEEYADDINTLSSVEERSSLVENDRTILGYIPDDKDILGEDGSIKLSELLPFPRTNHADYPFYGKNFLYLAEESPVLAGINNEVMVYLIRALQWVRYNGVSIDSFCTLVRILCSDFLVIDSIEWNHEDGSYGYANVRYHVIDSIEYENKLMRINTLKMIVGRKFPQFVFIDINDVETVNV